MGKRVTGVIFMLSIIILGLLGCTTPRGEAAQEQSQPEAYFLVFEDMYNQDTVLNGDIKYISLDIEKAELQDKKGLIELFKGFCDKNGFTLLIDNYEGLIEKGYIKDMYFEDGIIIKYEDVALKDNKLVTNVSKWRSGKGAIGGKYTLEKKDGKWKIISGGVQWIS